MANRKAKSTTRPARSARHHGQLRDALVDATLAMIEQRGAEDVTLRAVARAAGVSHMAPYNHFDDRGALIAAAAAAGFRRMRQEMETRMAAFAAGDPRRLQAVGVAYVVFAAANPQLFRLMFGPELADTTGHPELRETAHAVYGTLLGALGIAAPPPAGAAPPPAAVAPWALVHGLAMLLVTGQLPAGDTAQVEAVATEATTVLFVGLRSAMGQA